MYIDEAKSRWCENWIWGRKEWYHWQNMRCLIGFETSKQIWGCNGFWALLLPKLLGLWRQDGFDPAQMGFPHLKHMGLKQQVEWLDLLQIKESLTLPMDALYSCFMLLGWCGASTISDPFRGFLECPLKEWRHQMILWTKKNTFPSAGCRKIGYAPNLWPSKIIVLELIYLNNLWTSGLWGTQFSDIPVSLRNALQLVIFPFVTSMPPHPTLRTIFTEKCPNYDFQARPKKLLINNMTDTSGY